jgi:hypothetical protein
MIIANWSAKWKEKPDNDISVMVTSAYRSTRELFYGKKRQSPR